MIVQALEKGSKRLKQAGGIPIQLPVAPVQFSCSVVSDSVTPRTAARQASLSFIISQSLFKLMSIESVMTSSHLILCCPLLLLLSIFPSIRVFSSESVLHIRWLKNWSLSISPSNEYWRLVFFRIDWFDLLAVQGTLKCLLQHHNLKASTSRHSAFFYCLTLTFIHIWQNQLLGQREIMPQKLWISE